MYALVLIGQLIAEPFSSFALYSKLAWLLVRFKPSNQGAEPAKFVSETVSRKIFFEKYGNLPDDPDRKQLLKNMEQDF